MPRTKRLTHEDPREVEIRREIFAGIGELRITHKELAARIGIAPVTLSRRLSKNGGGIRTMTLGEYWDIQDTIERFRKYGR